jgi:hypothetical protein
MSSAPLVDPEYEVAGAEGVEQRDPEEQYKNGDIRQG